MDTQKYDIDKWKDHVLSVLVENSEGTLSQTIWGSWKTKFPIENNDYQKRNLLFQNCVLDCLEKELQLVRTDGRNGICITEKGKIVQKQGFRNYMNSQKRHETLQRINDYVTTSSGIFALVTALVSFGNSICEWWSNTLSSHLPSVLLAVIFITSCLFKKLK